MMFCMTNYKMMNLLPLKTQLKFDLNYLSYKLENIRLQYAGSSIKPSINVETNIQLKYESCNYKLPSTID